MREEANHLPYLNRCSKNLKLLSDETASLPLPIRARGPAFGGMEGSLYLHPIQQFL